MPHFYDWPLATQTSFVNGDAVMTTLNLRGSKISGTLPHNLMPQLSKLTHFDMDATDVSGTIPVQLSKLTNLQTLPFDNTLLTGHNPIACFCQSNGAGTATPIKVRNNLLTPLYIAV